MANEKAQQDQQASESYRTSEDNVTERSGPTIQDQADSVLRGEATSVDMGQGGVEEPERSAEQAQPADEPAEQPKKTATKSASKSNSSK